MPKGKMEKIVRESYQCEVMKMEGKVDLSAGREKKGRRKEKKEENEGGRGGKCDEDGDGVEEVEDEGESEVDQDQEGERGDKVAGKKKARR